MLKVLMFSIDFKHEVKDAENTSEIGFLETAIGTGS